MNGCTILGSCDFCKHLIVKLACAAYILESFPKRWCGFNSFIKTKLIHGHTDAFKKTCMFLSTSIV